MATRFAAHRRHAAQKGITLIEVMVASVILGIIAVPLGAAVSLGIRVLGGSALQGHLAAANDLLAIERQLGRDVGHADCVVGGGQSSCPTGSCSTGQLCVAWYDCHAAAWDVVSYAWTPATGHVVRSDSSGGAPVVVAYHVTGFSPSFVTGHQLDVAIQTTVGGATQQSDVKLLPLPAQLGSQCS